MLRTPLKDALTFDDVLLVPAHSRVLPSQVVTKTRRVKVWQSYNEGGAVFGKAEIKKDAAGRVMAGHGNNRRKPVLGKNAVFYFHVFYRQCPLPNFVAVHDGEIDIIVLKG